MNLNRDSLLGRLAADHDAATSHEAAAQHYANLRAEAFLQEQALRASIAEAIHEAGLVMSYDVVECDLAELSDVLARWAFQHKAEPS